MKLRATKTSRYFTRGRTYEAKRIFAGLMAWDNGDVGRFIELRDDGFVVIGEKRDVVKMG